MPRENSPVWFITGCSTGFGKELARLLLGRGFRVVATARDASKLADLVGEHEQNALAVPLDVTNPREVADSVKKAEAKFGRIDVLVNNAGYGYFAAIEEGESSEVRAIFETNVFGLIEMSKAVLPIMRRQRRGHIVNISSIGGLVGFPGVGYYNATKFAVEGLSEALSKELEPLGIKVLIVEPGPFRTDWAGRSLKMTKHEISDYVETAGARRRQVSDYSGKQPGDPVRAAEAMIKAVESSNPPLRLLLGKMAFETAQQKIESLSKETQAWKDVTLGADYPK
jgi:NAD(P)-dependent dehydrogenase (short-subunit alcohol dehydrogenase family)